MCKYELQFPEVERPGLLRAFLLRRLGEETYAGRMFWFTRKKLLGSYFRFNSVRRW